jgi:hypothetical protein
MEDLSESHRQKELDAFSEATAEEIELNKFERDAYVAKLSASLETADQLELAAFLSRERRDVEEVAAEKEIAKERKTMADKFTKEENKRIKDLATLNTEIAKTKSDAEDQAIIDEAKRLEDLVAAEKKYQDEIDKINSDALIEENKIAKEQFETNKALSIASIWMNAASAIAGFWVAAATLGPIAGPIFGGVMTGAMGAMGLVQTGMVNDQEFIPAREFGGMSSGPTRINEAGGEIVTLPDNSQVIPNDISRQIANNAGSAGSAGSDVIINFYDTQLHNDVDVDDMITEISYRLGRELGRAM